MLSVPILQLFMIAAGVITTVVTFERARRRRLLAPAEGLLEGAVSDPHGRWASGTRAGHAVTFRLTTRTAGRSSQCWTEIELALPLLPVVLSIRPSHVVAERQVARGQAVDRTLGDPSFDAAFIVEVAPLAVVRRALNAELRRRLLALAPLELELGERRLVLATKGWHDDAATVGELVALLVAIAEGLGEALSAAEAAQIGFRGGARLTAAERAEVMTLRLVQARRARALRRLRLVGLGITGLVMLTLTLLHAYSP